MLKKALIMIDIQNDFCPSGQLAVTDGDAVVPLANRLQDNFDCIIATKDWHPQNHSSFASSHKDQKIGDIKILNGVEQVLWPDHCISESTGAEFHPDLNTDKITTIFYKGIDKNIDSYSAFFDNAHLRSTGLHDYLNKENIQDLYLMGLATDYCVKFSALDAKQLGFNVYLITDACRGVELKPGDIANAILEMKMAGVKLICSDEVFNFAECKVAS